MLDHPVLTERYFFPRPGRPGTGAWEITGAEGDVLVCFRKLRAENRYTVVYYHGNGETVADHLPSPARQWLELGVNLVIVSYRGYGGSGGSPKLAAMLDDTRCVYEALQMPPSQLVLFGRSLGSLYACEFVNRYPQVAGLILESGIADPLQRVLLRAHPEELGGTAQQLQEEVAARLNQRAKLAAYAGPVLVMHAQNDTLVDATHAKLNHDWAAGEKKRLVLFERGDHNSILAANQERYFQVVREFIESLAY